MTWQNWYKIENDGLYVPFCLRKAQGLVQDLVIHALHVGVIEGWQARQHLQRKVRKCSLLFYRANRKIRAKLCWEKGMVGTVKIYEFKKGRDVARCRHSYLIQQGSKCPPINRFSVAFVFQNFRGQIFWRTTEGFGSTLHARSCNPSFS
jgi:hypothetical protein